MSAEAPTEPVTEAAAGGEAASAEAAADGAAPTEPAPDSVEPAMQDEAQGHPQPADDGEGEGAEAKDAAAAEAVGAGVEGDADAEGGGAGTDPTIAADTEAPPSTQVADEWLRCASLLPLGAEGAEARDEIFGQFDTDGDGTLTLDEAMVGLQTLLGVEPGLWDKALLPVVTEGFRVVSEDEGGVSREAFWKLCVYVRRHCELYSALGRASTVDAYLEQEAAFAVVSDEQFDTIIVPTAEAWGVPKPEGGLLALDTDGDGVVSLAELSAWACADCVTQVLTHEDETPEEPIVVPEVEAEPAAEAEQGGAQGHDALTEPADEAEPGEEEEVPLSEEMKAMSGHVEGLVMPGSVSKRVTMATPGQQRDSIRDLRKTKVADAARVHAPGDLTDSLVENTAMYTEGPGRGLNSDGPKRSKIQPIRKQLDMDAPALPSLRVVAPGSPSVDLDALRMDPDRKALAQQFGFGEVVPAPMLPSHAPTGWTPMPVRSERQPLAEKVHHRAPAPVSTMGAAGAVNSGPLAAQGYPSPTRRKQDSVSGDGAGSLSRMAERSVALVQAESSEKGAARRGPGGRSGTEAIGVQPQPAPSRAAPPVASKNPAGNGSRAVAAKGGITWESLEEMSFEELLSMDAKGVPFAQMPPLPEFNNRSGPSSRAEQTKGSGMGPQVNKAAGAKVKGGAAAAPSKKVAPGEKDKAAPAPVKKAPPARPPPPAKAAPKPAAATPAPTVEAPPPVKAASDPAEAPAQPVSKAVRAPGGAARRRPPGGRSKEEAQPAPADMTAGGVGMPPQGYMAPPSQPPPPARRGGGKAKASGGGGVPSAEEYAAYVQQVQQQQQYLAFLQQQMQAAAPGGGSSGARKGGRGKGGGNAAPQGVPPGMVMPPGYPPPGYPPMPQGPAPRGPPQQQHLPPAGANVAYDTWLRGEQLQQSEAAAAVAQNQRAGRVAADTGGAKRGGGRGGRGAGVPPGPPAGFMPPPGYPGFMPGYPPYPVQ
jgi:hypothetical protein